MTVPRAYMKQMQADQEYRRRKAELEASGDADLLRFLEIKRQHRDPDDPSRLMEAQFGEAIRQYVLALGLCEDCLAKLPDPLSGGCDS